MQWFRCYSDITDNYKLKILSFEDRWHYIAFLCCKAQGMLDGKRPDFIRRVVAVKLGLSSAEFDEVVRRLSEAYLIDQKTFQPIGWNDRQFISDNSNERVKKYRNNRASLGLPVGNAYQKYYADLIRRDEGKCVYCGSTENLCIDHMHPLSQGGTDDPDNLAIACKKCNSGKAGRTPLQAGYSISESASIAYNSFIKKNNVTVTQTICNGVSNGPDTDTDTEKEKITKKKVIRGARLPEDWRLPKKWGDWVLENFSMSIDAVRLEADKFRDYWISLPGSKGTKTDWEATWRNWIRKNATEKSASKPVGIFSNAL